MKAHRPASTLLTLLTLLLAGCAGYQPGPLPDSRVATVFLEPVQNEAYLSGIAPLFQSALHRGILESRLLRPVNSPAEADMIAYVRLRDFEEQPVAFLESDTGQPISARVSLSAVITLWDGEETLIVEDETVRAEAAVYSSPQTAFSNPIDQTKPAIVRNLARRVLLELELKRP
jgi:hypothetical protein